MNPDDQKLARELTRELRAIGVSRTEVTELTRAAQRLSRLRVPGMSRAARRRIEARLPFSVEPPAVSQAQSPFRLQLRWALTGSFAALAILVGTVILFQGSPEPSTTTGEQKAREIIQPTTPDAQDVEQHAEQLQQLQEQPTVNKEEVQKAKDRFLRSYEQYEQRHSKDHNFDNPWKNFEREWWWRATQSSKQLPSSGTPNAAGGQH